MSKTRLLVMLLSVIAAGQGAIALAQQPDSQSASAAAPAVKDADALFQKQDWAAASSAYAAITEREPGNGRAWYRLGYALHAMGQYEQAVKAFHRAVEIGSNPLAMYNLACGYARLNNQDQAFAWLSRAVSISRNR